MTDHAKHENLVARARAHIAARHAAASAPADPRATPRPSGAVTFTAAGLEAFADSTVRTAAASTSDLHARIARLETRHVRDNRAVFWILVGMVALIFTSATVFTVQQWRIADATKRATRAVEQVSGVVAQIQVERRRNTLIVCRAANEQKAALRGFFIGIVPAERRNDPATRAFIALANRTFPRRDCERELRERVHSAAAPADP